VLSCAFSFSGGDEATSGRGWRGAIPSIRGKAEPDDDLVIGLRGADTARALGELRADGRVALES